MEAENQSKPTLPSHFFKAFYTKHPTFAQSHRHMKQPYSYSADKSNSPTHRSVSISEIRVARVTTANSAGSGSGDSQQASPSASTMQQTVHLAGTVASGSSIATVATVKSSGTNSMVVIKQETLATVDNLVGSYVDSTTFLHSPSNSQMINPNIVQNSGMGSVSGAGELFIHNFGNKIKKKIKTNEK